MKTIVQVNISSSMASSISIATTTVTTAAGATMPVMASAAQQPLMQQQPQMPITDPITATGIYYSLKPLVVYPAWWISKLLALLLRPVLYLLHWLAWPFISLANGLWSLITLPIFVLLKFEAFLTFLLVAAIIGGLTGVILYFTSSFTNRALGLTYSEEDSKSFDLSKEDDSGRSVAEFRASRKAKKEKGKQLQVHSPREEKMFQDLLAKADYVQSSDAGSQGRLPLTTQTILEEDDSSCFEQF